MHLLLPLLASILFVCGLILIKRAGAAGAGPVTTLFMANGKLGRSVLLTRLAGACLLTIAVVSAIVSRR